MGGKKTQASFPVIFLDFGVAIASKHEQITSENIPGG